MKGVKSQRALNESIDPRHPSIDSTGLRLGHPYTEHPTHTHTSKRHARVTMRRAGSIHPTRKADDAPLLQQHRAEERRRPRQARSPSVANGGLEGPGAGRGPQQQEEQGQAQQQERRQRRC